MRETTISGLQLWAGATVRDLERAPASSGDAPDVLALDIAVGQPVPSAQLRTLRASGTRLYLKVASSVTGADLDQLIAALLPDGIVPSGLDDPKELQKLDALLSVAEVRSGLTEGQTAIAILVDNARILTKLQDVPDQSKRLTAIGWDGDRLAESLRLPRASSDHLSGPVFSTVQSLVLISARAAGAIALDYAPQRLSPTDAMMRLGAISADDGFDGLFCGTPPMALTV
jgi:citrate lyase beta subunit